MRVFDLSNRRKKALNTQTEEPAPEVPLEIPVEISGEYVDNLNITAIDVHIKKMFETKLQIADNNEREIKRIDETLRDFKGFPIDRYTLINKKRELGKTLRPQVEADLNEYINATTDILQRYKPLNVKRCFIRSGRKQRSEKSTNDEEIENIKIKKRLELIDAYLAIASKYIKTNFVKLVASPGIASCEICGEQTGQNEETACGCGLILPVVSKLSSYKETGRNASGQGGSAYYEDLKNFMKALHAFQGLQTSGTNFPTEKLYEELDEYFVGIERQPGEYYRALPLLASGKKEGTSFQDLILALDKTKNSDQYNNAHLIAKEYWGWKLLDLSKYEEQIIQDYNLVQKIWYEEKDRDSSPNVKIRLYLHLRARGIPVLKEDFKFPVTSSCINYYNDKLRPIFEECGLHYERLI